MKYAIISDVHANLEAVTECFKEIERLKADRVICLGDLVDYCAQPNEVVDIIKNNCDAVILGNHDEAQYRYEMIERYTEFARISSIHTRSVIKPQHIEYFRTLPYTHTENDILFVHASPLNPESYKYVLDNESAEVNFNAFSERICFIGHSHKPAVFQKNNSEVFINETGKLEKNCRYIINVGSVGQPRDGNPKLSFGFYDSTADKYSNIRVTYDSAAASKKISAEGLPAMLAERILEGK